MSQVDWSNFRRSLNPDSVQGAVSVLDELARWWLTPQAKKMAAELLQRDYWLGEPILSQQVGSCWIMVVNRDTSTHELLKAAFLLPLIWLPGIPHDPRLPQAVAELAREVTELLDDAPPHTTRDWGLQVYFESEPRRAIPANEVMEYPDLSQIPVWPDEFRSGWTALAGGLYAACRGSCTKSNVWVTGAWDHRSGITQIGGVKDKLRLADAYFRETPGLRERDMYVILPVENFAEATREANEQSYQFNLVRFLSGENDPVRALDPYLELLGVSAPDAGRRELQANESPEAGLFEVRRFDRYRESDAAYFLGRDADVDKVVDLLSWNPIVLLKGDSGVGKSSLLHAGLCPKLRSIGWHVAVLRPGQNPGQSVPSGLTLRLLRSGNFSPPLDYARFRSEMAPLLSTKHTHGLVLVMDQMEELAWDHTDASEIDTVRRFLQDIYRDRNKRPLLKVVCAYRHDVSIRLERIWQDISGDDAGLRYHVLEGLTIDNAAEVLRQAIQKRDWAVNIEPIDLAERLSEQSRGKVGRGQVYPLFVQIVMAECEPSRTLTAASLSEAGDVAGIIGCFLRGTLADLEAEGGHGKHARRILESLSGSRGQRVSRTVEELASETNLSERILQDVLRRLESKRLIRRLGVEFEILHDQLASAIISGMGDHRRQAKRSVELLDAKRAKYQVIRELHSDLALVDVFQHRHEVRVTREQQLFLLGSRIAGQEFEPDSPRPRLPIGWFWFRQQEVSAFRKLLADLCDDPQPEVRSAAVSFLGVFGDEADLPIGMAMLEDSEERVCASAIGMIAQFDKAEIKTLLQHLIKDYRRPLVRQAAVRALAFHRTPTDLPDVQQLAHDRDPSVQQAALEQLQGDLSSDDLPWLRNWLDDGDPILREFAVRMIARFEHPEDLPRLRNMLDDDVASIRRSAVEAIGRFSDPDDLTVFVHRMDDPDTEVQLAAESAIAEFDEPSGLPALRSLARDPKWNVRQAVVQAIGCFAKAEDANLVRTLVRDENRLVRQVAVQMLPRFREVQDLPWLFDILQSCSEEDNRNDPDMADAAARAIAEMQTPEAPDLLVKMIADPPGVADDAKAAVREAAIRALAPFGRSEDVPMFEMLTTDENWRVRHAALQVLASCNDPAHRPFFLRLTEDPDDTVRLSAARALAQFALGEDEEVFCRLVLDESAEVREVAVQALAKRLRAEYLDLLRERIEDEDEDVHVRSAALDAIEGNRDPDSVPLLQEFAQAADYELRQAATLSLTRIAERNFLGTWLDQWSKDLHSDVLRILDEELYSPEWWHHAEV